MVKINVLLVHNFYKIAGGEDTVFNSEKEMLEKNGHIVSLYTRNNHEIKTKGLLSKLYLFILTIFSIKTYKEVKKLIKANNIDVVHIHNTLPLISPSIYYAAVACKVPIVQTIHNFRLMCPAATFCRKEQICEECIKKGLKIAIKHKCYRNSYFQTFTIALMIKIHKIIGTYDKVDGYISLTEFNRDRLTNVIKDKNKLFIKPNFIKVIENCEDRNIGEYFVFVGRIDKLKGIHILIDAWKNIKDTKLFILGVGPESEYVKTVVKSNNLYNVNYLGYRNRESVLNIIKNSKALIVPSQWYEGLPMTIVESFSLGVPVICGDIGNLKLIVEDNKNGLHFTYDSSEDLVKKINLLIHDNILNEKLKRGAFETYTKFYSEDKNYKCLMEIYGKVMVNKIG